MPNACDEDMSLLLGIAIGWCFGSFIATLMAVTAQRRGEEAGGRSLQRFAREVERDEHFASLRPGP